MVFCSLSSLYKDDLQNPKSFLFFGRKFAPKQAEFYVSWPRRRKRQCFKLFNNLWGLGTELSYRPVRTSWNRFLGSLKFKNLGSGFIWHISPYALEYCPRFLQILSAYLEMILQNANSPKFFALSIGSELQKLVYECTSFYRGGNHEVEKSVG